jgi:L-asparaginase
MTPQPGGSVAPALTAGELLAAVPGLADTGIEVDIHDFRRLPGASLTFTDLDQLIAAISEQAGNGTDGIVITQGTDTIEETSYYLDLRYNGETPVVVTGAMRNPSMAGADGPANILAALRVAAAEQSRGRGCLVVFADEIHEARRVRKAHSTSVTAFSSSFGPIGYVAEGEVRFHGPSQRGLIIGPEPEQPARTAIVTATLGDDGETLRTVGESADGIVVAAFGVGHVPAVWVPILAELAERMPVVLASRTSAGPVLSRTYGFPGSESDLLARGLISAGTLPPVKARILLHLLLTTAASRSDIEKSFTQVGA